MSEPTEEERQAARALWAELGREELALPTPEQLLAFFRRCPDAIALDLAGILLEDYGEARHCRMSNHESELAHLRARLDAAQEQAKREEGE